MSEQKARLNRITITSWQKVDIPKGGRNRIQRKRNLPRWARDNPAELWQCADLFERKMARLTVNILSVYRVS